MAKNIEKKQSKELKKLTDKELPNLKKIVERSSKYFKENYERFNKMKQFVFFSTLNESLSGNVPDESGFPKIEANLCEAFISRLFGEFSKQEPSIEVSSDYNAKVDSKIIKIVEGYFRHLECEMRKNGVAYNIFRDSVGAGFSAFKIYTDYINDGTFDQAIKIDKVFDPTLIGFDPSARDPHKGDGEYCFELFPKTKEELMDFLKEECDLDYTEDDLKGINYQEKINGFNWSYGNDVNKTYLICVLYKKKKSYKEIVEVSSTPFIQQNGLGTIMEKKTYEDLLENWDKLGILEQPPEIIQSRNSSKDIICRYTFIGNKILDYKETDFSFLPIVFVDGNSTVIRKSSEGESKQVCRPYFYNAIGTQQLANVALRSIGNELENSIQHKFIVAHEAIPEGYEKAYKNVQVPNVLVYNAFLDERGEVPLPRPEVVVRPPMPPEMLQTLQLSFQLMQNVLGSFDASLGINNNQLSGTAIIEGATQSNATAMPYIVSYMQSLNQVAKIVLDLIPKYYLSPREIPFLQHDGKRGKVPVNYEETPSLNYNPNELQINVEAGISFTIQKSKTLNQLISLMQVSKTFDEFMNQSGLQVLLDNIDVRGIDQLKELADQFMQQLKVNQQIQQQMSMQSNPLLISAQAKMLEAQTKMQNQQVNSQLQSAELQIKEKVVENETLRTLANIDEDKRNSLIQIDKHETEKTRAAVDLATKLIDNKHKREMESAKISHNILDGIKDSLKI